MIRVKTILLKQTLEKIVYALIILLIVLLVLLASMLGIHMFKMRLQNGEFLASMKLVSSDNLVTRIIESEMPLISYSDKTTLAFVDKPRQETEIKVDFTPAKKQEYSLPNKYEATICENGKIQIGNSKVTNYSKLALNLEELTKIDKTFDFENSDVLIFHTHATECYTGDSDENSNYRTLETDSNMIAVGEVLAEELDARGFDVTHDITLHDYPNYNGSYQASLSTIQNYMKKRSYDFVLDIHRDALSSDLNYAPTIDISGEKAAQLMFVIGTDACGLKHDNWMENLKLAIMIQNRANEMYPGLFRDLNLSASRYNQHVAKGAFIIEVGATGNTLEEAKNAVRLLTNVLDSF